METFFTIVIITLLLVFSKPLFSLASGLAALIFGGVVVAFLFSFFKVLLFEL